VTATPLPSSAPSAVPRRVWWFVIISACVVAAVVVVSLPGAIREVGGDWRNLWQPFLYAAGLVLAERFVVKVPMRNHRFSVGVTDMVIVLGVVFIDMPVLVMATVLGITTSQLLVEPHLVKRLFNVFQYVLSVTAAAGLTSLALDLVGPGTRSASWSVRTRGSGRRWRLRG